MIANEIVQWLVMAAIPVALFAGRHWLQKRIESGVQHKFDKRLEVVRAELRAGEEALKSELRAREAQLAALRDGVLSGRLHRQNLLEERRLQAAERIWAAVIDLQKYKNSAATMAVLKDFHLLAPRASNDQTLPRFFGGTGRATCRERGCQY